MIEDNKAKKDTYWHQVTNPEYFIGIEDDLVELSSNLYLPTTTQT